MLTDLRDHHVFYDKLTLIYLEMPKVGKASLDMGRPLDRWLQALYGLWAGNDRPDELDEPVFQKLYKQAEYARLNSDQQLTYIRSRKYCLDTYNEIKGGRILGRMEDREEGREERTMEIARRMKGLGIDKETILKSVEITEEEFENL
jgi:predicted transposase/invertase (TIGR01784 family)